MANNLALYNFPDSYYTNLVETAASVKYVSASGSDSNNGNTVSTPYLTIAKALTDTSATNTTVTIVILAGTYVITPQANGSSYATSAIADSNKPRVFVGAPGKVKIQFTNASGYGPYAVDFQNSGSACYGIIFERNNAGKANNYEVAIFCGSSTVGNLKGNFYNCAFTETNANYNWALQYDNESRIASQVNNCTFKFYEAAMADYTGGPGLVLNYSVFSQANPGGNSTKSNTLYSQTVDATTYVTTGVTTAGVYSGTYAWNGTTTMPTGLYSSAGTFYSGVATTITLATSGVANGSTVAYTISGVTSAEISGAPLTGNFIINNNSGSISITPLRTLLSGSISIISGGYAAMWPISYPVAFTTSVNTQPSNQLVYPAIIIPPVLMDRVALSATYTIDTVNTPRVINNSNRTANTSGSTAMASLTGPTLDANVKQKTVGGSTVQTVQTTTVEQTREYWL